jgi:SAM-dependent methyltransferase
VVYAQSAKAKEVYGIELVKEQAKVANEKGVKTFAFYADRDIWTFENNSLHCVVSNQVIEHLSDVDHFISEAYRVLKPGGYLITSTNNLSSWHNIFSLVFGWTPFDFTNSSKRGIGIGNPFALHQGEVAANGDSWTHKTIFNKRWLNEWFSLYGFAPVKDYGSGYHPLPPAVGKYFKKHCAFMVLVNKK